MGLVRLAGLEIVIRVKFAVRVNTGHGPVFLKMFGSTNQKTNKMDKIAKNPGRNVRLNVTSSVN